MNFEQFNAAVNDAESTLRFADRAAKQIAEMLRGRLRKVPSWVLKDLKRELRDFNMHTGEWKQ